MKADDWIAIGTILLFGATLLGASFVFMELRSGHREAKGAHDRARRQATIDFYTRTLEQRISWEESDLPYIRNAEAVDLMLKKLEEDPHSDESEKRKKQLRSYLGFWELTAVAIIREVFDEEIFRDMLETHFLLVEKRYRSFMDEARNERGSDTEQLYVKMKELAARWNNPQLSRRRGIVRWRPGRTTIPLADRADLTTVSQPVRQQGPREGFLLSADHPAGALAHVVPDGR